MIVKNTLLHEFLFYAKILLKKQRLAELDSKIIMAKNEKEKEILELKHQIWHFRPGVMHGEHVVSEALVPRM